VPEPEQVEQFTAVYGQHYRQVYGYAVARAGREFADEVVADTFLVAWRQFAVLPKSAPLPWLLAVARNVVRERYREEARRRAVAAEMRAWLGEEELLAADVADGVAERAAVLAALARRSTRPPAPGGSSGPDTMLKPATGRPELINYPGAVFATRLVAPLPFHRTEYFLARNVQWRSNMVQGDLETGAADFILAERDSEVYQPDRSYRRE
jgi:hypothetical protein